jgi:hypothetical protein
LINTAASTSRFIGRHCLLCDVGVAVWSAAALVQLYTAGGHGISNKSNEYCIQQPHSVLHSHEKGFELPAEAIEI